MFPFNRAKIIIINSPLHIDKSIGCAHVSNKLAIQLLLTRSPLLMLPRKNLASITLDRETLR